jgi:hypothetical protein
MIYQYSAQHTSLLTIFIAVILITQGCAAPATRDAAKPDPVPSQAPVQLPSTTPESTTTNYPANYPAIGVFKLIQVGEVFSSKYQPPGLRKELVYVGFTGYVMNFIYKEYKDNNPQPSVTEEAKYDISKTGKYFSHRGARFEMRSGSGSSTSIMYKTLKQFD